MPEIAPRGGFFEKTKKTKLPVQIVRILKNEEQKRKRKVKHNIIITFPFKSKRKLVRPKSISILLLCGAYRIQFNYNRETERWLISFPKVSNCSTSRWHWTNHIITRRLSRCTSEHLNTSSLASNVPFLQPHMCRINPSPSQNQSKPASLLKTTPPPMQIAG